MHLGEIVQGFKQATRKGGALLGIGAVGLAACGDDSVQQDIPEKASGMRQVATFPQPPDEYKYFYNLTLENDDKVIRAEWYLGADVRNTANSVEQKAAEQKNGNEAKKQQADGKAAEKQQANGNEAKKQQAEGKAAEEQQAASGQRAPPKRQDLHLQNSSLVDILIVSKKENTIGGENWAGDDVERHAYLDADRDGTVDVYWTKGPHGSAHVTNPPASISVDYRKNAQRTVKETLGNSRHATSLYR